MRQRIFFPRAFFFLFLTVHFLFFARPSLPETVDRVLAVVNEQVITLTDLRIIEEFRLYGRDIRENAENFDQLVLDELIGQKLVVQHEAGQISVDREEINSALGRMITEMGEDEFEAKLDEFSMNRDDLEGYIREKIAYQKVISLRFNKGSMVSLKEIEDYYNQVYVPTQTEKGLKPQPMLDILNEIESTIVQAKIDAQIKAWIKSLKRRADVQVIIES